MKRWLTLLPLGLLALSACSNGSAPASSYSPGSPGGPVQSGGTASPSGLGDSGGNAGTNGTPTNPAQND